MEAYGFARLAKTVAARIDAACVCVYTCVHVGVLDKGATKRGGWLDRWWLEQRWSQHRVERNEEGGGGGGGLEGRDGVAWRGA